MPERRATAAGWLVAAVVLAAATGAIAVPVAVIGLALAAQGLAALGIARLRDGSRSAPATHLAQAGLAWAIALVAGALLVGWPLARLQARPALGSAMPVSYTHLTLPTICSV